MEVFNMKYTGLNELRKKFLEFFESKGHLKLPSFPLIPKNDNSLLLINSGMAPMKKYFTGEVTPPSKRVTTCQKCIRTPDIELVGVTARHITYFEMLGNFSFGDYFKNEITAWAWEFCTKVLELPEDKLWISIYENDDETFDIWTKKVGVNPSHIVRLGKEDNFWEHGEGPCGPCSELYFDRGEKYSCGSPNCTVGCDCDRYVEFWNLVFTQFENDGNGNYSKLDRTNIDTGMGLERLACIMQGADNVFMIDTMQSIMNTVCKIANVKYGLDSKTDTALRIITDHIRSTTVMIADGVMPSNEGRGYVLRRLLRRAARQGKLLGIDKPFLFEICDTVIDENKEVYPELLQKRDFIKTLVKKEEENFSKTIDQGLALLNEAIKKSNNKVLSGDEAFKLNDTYGFPIDLTKEILSEKGMTVDEKRFNELLSEQKIRARNARLNAGADAWKSEGNFCQGVPKTIFCGYNQLEVKAKVLKVVKSSDNKYINVILDKTPFYAQSGGQVGDIGVLENENLKLKVNNTIKNTSDIFIHETEIISGDVSDGDELFAKVDKNFRKAVARNHTGAHLLQAALRAVLGNHVEQAGQLVNEKQIRFDFTHFSALTIDELDQVENLVNEKILSGLAGKIEEVPITKAKEMGAIALFNEKYGDVVRVVSFGDFSIELCGGTHVDNTAKLGLFKILSESSVASGVRRIEAVTGLGVLDLLNKNIFIIEDCAKTLKISDSKNLYSACEKMTNELKEKNALINELEQKIAKSKVKDLLSSKKDVNGVSVFYAKLSNSSVKELRTICDEVKNNVDGCVIVLIGIEQNKAVMLTSVDSKAQKYNLSAGNIVKKLAAFADGNGGGKSDFAMAGIKNIAKIDLVLDNVTNVIESEFRLK